MRKQTERTNKTKGNKQTKDISHTEKKCSATEPFL